MILCSQLRISVDTPTVGLAYGGVVAAPAFSEIAEQSMRILGVEPDINLVQPQPTVETIGSATNSGGNLAELRCSAGSRLKRPYLA